MRREGPLGEDPEPSILIHSLFARGQIQQLMFYVCPLRMNHPISHIIQFTESLQILQQNTAEV